MSWNYRVMRRPSSGADQEHNYRVVLRISKTLTNELEEEYGLYEVYEDNSISDDIALLSANSIESLKTILEKMEEATKLPVLDYDSIPHRKIEALICTYAIHEVYLDKSFLPNGMTQFPVGIASADLEGIQWIIKKMREATDKDVLDYDALNR